jgi:cysteine sulfinate desulfinase/cysteine desulfurase-like protein
MKTSRVLKMLGYDDSIALSVLRLSMGHMTTQEEVQGFLKTYVDLVERWKPEGFKAQAA